MRPELAEWTRSVAPVGDGLPLLLRGAEVARLLGIGRSTAFMLMASGELPVVRIGRSVRVSREALYGWLERRIEWPANGEWAA